MDPGPLAVDREVNQGAGDRMHGIEALMMKDEDRDTAHKPSWPSIAVVEVFALFFEGRVRPGPPKSVSAGNSQRQSSFQSKRTGTLPTWETIAKVITESDTLESRVEAGRGGVDVTEDATLDILNFAPGFPVGAAKPGVSWAKAAQVLLVRWVRDEYPRNPDSAPWEAVGNRNTNGSNNDAEMRKTTTAIATATATANDSSSGSSKLLRGMNRMWCLERSEQFDEKEQDWESGFNKRADAFIWEESPGFKWSGGAEKPITPSIYDKIQLSNRLFINEASEACAVCPLLIFSAESLKKPSIGAWIIGSDLEGVMVSVIQGSCLQGRILKDCIPSGHALHNLVKQDLLRYVAAQAASSKEGPAWQAPFQKVFDETKEKLALALMQKAPEGLYSDCQDPERRLQDRPDPFCALNPETTESIKPRSPQSFNPNLRPELETLTEEAEELRWEPGPELGPWCRREKANEAPEDQAYLQLRLCSAIGCAKDLISMAAAVSREDAEESESETEDDLGTEEEESASGAMEDENRSRGTVGGCRGGTGRRSYVPALRSGVEQHVGRSLGIRDGFKGRCKLLGEGVLTMEPCAEQLLRCQLDAVSVESLHEFLSTKEKAAIPDKNDIFFAVISARAGVEPVWFVDAGDLNDYNSLGLKVVEGGKRAAARNKALEVKHLGAAVIKVPNQYVAHRDIDTDPKSMRTFGRQEYETHHHIPGDFFVADLSPVRFDESMVRKEDFVFTAPRPGMVVAVLVLLAKEQAGNRWMIEAKHRKNPGISRLCVCGGFQLWNLCRAVETSLTVAESGMRPEQLTHDHLVLTIAKEANLQFQICCQAFRKHKTAEREAKKPPTPLDFTKPSTPKESAKPPTPKEGARKEPGKTATPPDVSSKAAGDQPATKKLRAKDIQQNYMDSVITKAEKVPSTEYIAARCGAVVGQKVRDVIGTVEYTKGNGTKAVYACADLVYDVNTGFLGLDSMAEFSEEESRAGVGNDGFKTIQLARARVRNVITLYLPTAKRLFIMSIRFFAAPGPEVLLDSRLNFMHDRYGKLHELANLHWHKCGYSRWKAQNRSTRVPVNGDEQPVPKGPVRPPAMDRKRGKNVVSLLAAFDVLTDSRDEARRQGDRHPVSRLYDQDHLTAKEESSLQEFLDTATLSFEDVTSEVDADLEELSDNDEAGQQRPTWFAKEVLSSHLVL
ncbi:hypothetical protein AK812_SmicGene14537 [Symbiodinium microadriaticum]|uniref:Uncharacterized protein n=1 Tax=Symbiodinium microadriaticum TaxID=2951 RepID=A0A1Q9E570_SYMMI|nr:hypothetical protein AK812_SmicGene14537 [Symbiodinium microadriaticum]